MGENEREKKKVQNSNASSATVCNLNQKNRKKRKQKIATERSLRIIDSIDGIISRDNNSPSRSPFIYTTTTVQLSVRAEFLVSHRFSLLIQRISISLSLFLEGSLPATVFASKKKVN